MIRKIFDNWQYLLFGIFIVIALSSLFFNGIKLGIDFKGGTLYQIELQDTVSKEDIGRIANTLYQRIDPGQIRDVTVTPVGDKFIVVQLSETDPAELEKIEARIRQQGKFESTINGETVFTGDEIKSVLRGSNNYGVFKQGTAFAWWLPFVLSDSAAKSFAEKSFHQCAVTSIGTDGKPVYDCEVTYFFLDKPNALIVTSEEQYDEDSRLLYAGNRLVDIPVQTNIEKLIENAQLPVIIYTNEKGLDENIIATALLKTKKAIVSPDINSSVIVLLEAKGFEVSIGKATEGLPWIWDIMNARQVISLSEDVTNEDVTDISQATILTTLSIRGTRDNAQVARTDLEELTILLESGSLPTPVKSISRETVSPTLGEAILQNVLLMGIIALITVGAIIFLRYRNFSLSTAIFMVGILEIIVTMGLFALLRKPFDLAAFAGLIAAIGTGVDSEIVITDELMRGERDEHVSLLQRVKAGIFIIFSSSAVAIGVVLPILIFNFGLEKLVGFATTAIIGALIGMFISRPAFSKFAQRLIEKKERQG